MRSVTTSIDVSCSERRPAIRSRARIPRYSERRRVRTTLAAIPNNQARTEPNAGSNRARTVNAVTNTSPASSSDWSTPTRWARWR